VPGEEDPDAGATGRIQHAGNALCHLRAVGELADDTDLHVIDEQRHALRVACIRQRVGDPEVAMVLHGVPFGCAVAA
jgi:hypothetical protein